MTSHPLHAAALLAGVLAFPAAFAVAAEPEVGRADVANAFIRFERAYLDSGSTGDRLALVNREFDRLTRVIFFDRLDEALRRLEALSHALATSGPLDGPARVFLARVDPPVASRLANDRPLVTISSLDPVPAEDFTARVLLRAPDGSAAWQADRPAALDDEGRLALAITAPGSNDLPLGRLSIELAFPPDQPPVRIGSFAVVDRPLEEVRNEVELLLSGAERSGADRRDLAICRARAALLRDRAPANSIIHALADPAVLAREVADEARAISRGDHPYRLRPGDLWRTMELAGVAVPMRLYAPPGALAAGEPLPLVVALHGAGVDENMFMDGYGAGLIRALADDRGFLVATPLTYPFMSSVHNLEVLIDDLAIDYPVDRARVYMLGHSLGAIATCGFASAPRSPLAGAACLAGFRPLVGVESTPPMLVIAATLDPIFSVERMRSAVAAARAAGLPVESTEVPDQGHTLVVPATLPDAVGFLLRHRLER